jgi:hypothetical protein
MNLNKEKEKDLLQHFPEIQKLIKEWEETYSLPQDLLSVETEDKQPFITQPFYTYQIHTIS